MFVFEEQEQEKGKATKYYGCSLLSALRAPHYSPAQSAKMESGARGQRGAHANMNKILQMDILFLCKAESPFLFAAFCL